MLKEEIVKLLKMENSAYLSGQRISTQLGVSRAAVWKAIEALRKEGYEIDSRSNRGYRLVRTRTSLTRRPCPTWTPDRWAGGSCTSTAWIPPTTRSSVSLSTM